MSELISSLNVGLIFFARQKTGLLIIDDNDFVTEDVVSVGSLGRVISNWVEIGTRSVFAIELDLCSGLMVWFPGGAVGYFVVLGFWLFVVNGGSIEKA